MTAKKKVGGSIELQVHDYKKIKDLHVVLVAGLNEIAGPNGAGKSSGLDAVANIFGGKKLTPADPVREGADGFELKLALPDLGLLIRRIGTIKDGVLQEELIVTNPEGPSGTVPLGRPKEILDRLLGGHSVALESLMGMRNADRIELLRQISGLDFTDLDVERESIYEERTRLNAEAKAFKAQYEGMPDHGELPAEPVSIVDLMGRMQEIQSANSSNDLKRGELEDKTEEARLLADESKRLGAAALQAEAAAKTGERAAHAAGKVRDKLAEEVEALEDHSEELQAVQDEISGAGEVNRKIAERDSRVASVEAFTNKSAAAQLITNRIAAIDKQKEEALAGAKLPGKLTFDADGVYVKGLPLEQASEVEQMDIDIALAIERNPEVPIILIPRGSLYDKVHRDALDKLGKKHGVIIMFERVMDTEEEAAKEGVAVYMRDGVGVNVKKEEADADSE